MRYVAALLAVAAIAVTAVLAYAWSKAMRIFNMGDEHA